MLGRVSTSEGDRLLDENERPAAPAGIVGGRVGYGAVDEHNRRLQAHSDRFLAFRKARTCPPVMSATGMFHDLARIATCTVETADDSPEAVAAAEHIELGLGIGRDSPIGQQWGKTFAYLLECILDGAGYPETVPEEVDGVWYTAILPRDMASIDEWVVDSRDRLVGAWQNPISGWGATRKLIPASQAMHICWRPLSPTDFSGCGAYRAMEPLARDHTMLCSLRMVAAQRWAVGTPMAIPDFEARDRAGISPEQHERDGNELAAALKNYASHDRAYLKVPPGWRVEMFGSAPEALAAIDALIDSTARRIYEVLCMQFGMLGSANSGGSYNVGEIISQTARNMIQGVLEWLAALLNSVYVRRAILWQFGPDFPADKRPRIRFDGLASEAFANAAVLAILPALVTAGLVREDDAVRDAIRKALELPAEDPNNRPGPPRRNVGAPPLVSRPAQPQGVK